MFKVEPLDGWYWITGDADGGDWLMTPGRRGTRQHGVAATGHVWFYDERTELHIFNAPERRPVATLAVGSREHFGRDYRISLSLKVPRGQHRSRREGPYRPSSAISRFDPTSALRLPNRTPE